KMAANYGVQDFLVKDDYKDNLSVAVYEIIAKTEIKNNLYRTIHNLENINKGLDILNENNKVFLSHG
ncbi:MAG: hypothetical protein GTO02_16170, partial [Candidatus Dadabacteria bacterium]|nr:hypothetical protein [Candidatus Dadabacteria bacterium]